MSLEFGAVIMHVVYAPCLQNSEVGRLYLPRTLTPDSLGWFLRALYNSDFQGSEWSLHFYATFDSDFLHF